MKILGIVGSMRRNRHTENLVNRLIGEMRKREPMVETKLIHIDDIVAESCRVTCSAYCTEHPFECSVKDGAMDVLHEMIISDGIIFGSPLYFRGPPAKFHALMERLVSIFFFQESQGKSNVESPLAGKPCALIGVAEYSNPQVILEYLADFCHVLKMRPVLVDRFPYAGIAGQGDVARDVVFKPYELIPEVAAELHGKIIGRREA